MANTSAEPTDFDAYWNSKVFDQPSVKTNKGFSPEKTLRAFGRGLYEPIEQGALLLNRAAAYGTGVPYLEQVAKEQEARIKNREQLYTAALQGDDYSGSRFVGNLISPAPFAAGKAAGSLAKGPGFKSMLEGGAAALFAPSDPENYSSDKSTQALFGSLSGLFTRGVGGALNPAVTADARALMNKGVNVPPELAAEKGATRSFMHAARAIKELVGAGKGQEVTNRSFNNALANDILNPLGESVDKGVHGFGLARQLTDKVSNFYNSAYSKLGTALPDQQLINGINLVQASAARTMDKATYNKFTQIINNDVIGRFNIATKNQGRAIKGEDLKDMRSYLQDTLEGLKSGKTSDKYDNVKLRNALQAVKNSVFDYTDRVDQTGLIRRANKAWAEKSVFENAASRNPTTGVFDIEHLNSAVVSSSDTANIAKGTGKLQEKANPYLSVLQGGRTDRYTTTKDIGILGSLAGGSAYAIWQNPALGTAILTAAGVAPVVIQRMMRNPSKAREVIASAINKLGPSAVGYITQQVAQQQAAEDREQLRQINIPGYVNQDF